VVIALVVTWALTVVGVALVTWTVIDAAGHRVLDEAALPTSGAGQSTDQPARRPAHRHRADRTPTAATTPTRKPSAGSTPSSAGTSTHPAPPSSTPQATTSGGQQGSTATPHPGHFTHGTPHPAPSSSPPTTPQSTANTDTWLDSAGTITVTCEGDAIHLQGATPANGYRVEVEHEDEAIVVQFERDDPADEVHVRATCVNGRPHFEVEGHRASAHHEPGSDG
jgi:hypothetical protein